MYIRIKQLLARFIFPLDLRNYVVSSFESCFNPFSTD